MATLAADVARNYESNEDPIINDYDVIASDIIYGGAAVGESSSTGSCRPLVAGDNFLGFADEQADNSSGLISAETCRIRQRGTVQLDVVGVSAIAHVGDTAYASDDATFTLTSTANSAIGKVVRWITGTTCMVRFEGILVRSI